jgi:hypothetical protein
MNLRTRNLSPAEYLHQLEIEWWICNFRRKIYPSDFFNSRSMVRKNFGKIASLKRSRLIEISERNDLPTIFSDNKLMKQLNQKFNEGGGGCPIFEGITNEDIKNYYSDNADVRCFYGFDENKKPIVKIGKIKSCDLEQKIVEVILDNNVIESIEFNSVSRIF